MVIWQLFDEMDINRLTFPFSVSRLCTHITWFRWKLKIANLFITWRLRVHFSSWPQAFIYFIFRVCVCGVGEHLPAGPFFCFVHSFALSPPPLIYFLFCAFFISSCPSDLLKIGCVFSLWTVSVCLRMLYRTHSVRVHRECLFLLCFSAWVLWERVFQSPFYWNCMSSTSAHRMWECHLSHENVVKLCLQWTRTQINIQARAELLGLVYISSSVYLRTCEGVMHKRSRTLTNYFIRNTWTPAQLTMWRQQNA